MHAIILGAGWSGLSAAIHLIRKGIKPIILEASPKAGGRAREVDWNGIKIDNGQHLLLGAYTEFLNILDIINPKDFNVNSVIDRMPFELNFYNENYNRISISRKNNFYFKTDGLSIKDKISFLRFFKNIYFNKIPKDYTVKELIEKYILEKNARHIIESLCVSALTTNIEKACAHTFRNTLLDSIFKNQNYSDLLIPKVSLSALFVNPACDFIIKNGGVIHYNTRVTDITTNDTNQSITLIKTNKGNFSANNYISALPYFVISKLLNINEFNLKSEKITTVYIKYKNTPKLPHKIIGLLNHNIDYIFDKSNEHEGLISAISSSNNKFNNLSKKEMFEISYSEIKNLFRDFNDVEDYKIITEKFAAYCCDQNSKKINFNDKNIYKNLLFAGDYSYTRYPATLEGALRSGNIAANNI